MRLPHSRGDSNHTLDARLRKEGSSISTTAMYTATAMGCAVTGFYLIPTLPALIGGATFGLAATYCVEWYVNR